MLWANSQIAKPSSRKTRLTRLSMLVMGVLFAVSTFLSPTVSAATDATWKNETTITYKGTDFDRLTSFQGQSAFITAATDEGTGCGGTIFFPNSYPTATNARYVVTFFNGANGCNVGGTPPVSLTIPQWANQFAGKSTTDAKWKYQDTLNDGATDYKGPSDYKAPDGKTYQGFTASDDCTGSPRVVYFTSNYKTATYGWRTNYVVVAGVSCKMKSIQAITINKWTSDLPAGPGDEDNADTTVCGAGSFGWIICPAIETMQDASVAVAGYLDDLLRLNVLATTDEKGNATPTYQLWISLLNVANIVLVIGFLIIVASQATSYGISNYGIKKMLPRLIIAAVLMNISFFICQIMVDASNIIGAGAADLINKATNSVSFADSVTQQVGGLSEAVVGLGIIVVVALFFLVPAFVAILVVFFTIAARNAIIILLVIVAPLAFAAWVLPGTENYFKKWWKLLVGMLTLYPMVMIVFAASIVASKAVAATSGGDITPRLIALIIMALPLFAMPFIFKAAGGVLGQIHAMTNRGANKYGGGQAHGFLSGKSKGAVKDFSKRRVQNTGARLAANQVGVGADGKRKGITGQIGRFGSYTGNRKARKDWKYSQQESAAKRIQDEAVIEKATQHNPTTGKLELTGYGQKAAGVGGVAAQSRVLNIAQQQLQAAQIEATKAAVARFQVENISSDRGALMKVLRTEGVSAPEAGAAAELLLKTAGTEQLLEVIKGDATKGIPPAPGLRDRGAADAVVQAAIREYGTVDSKSPDFADAIGSASAVDKITAGTFDTGVVDERGVPHAISRKLPGGKLIKLEPQSIERLAAGGDILPEEAIAAINSPGYADAKPGTKAVLQRIAATLPSTSTPGGGGSNNPPPPGGNQNPPATPPTGSGTTGTGSVGPSGFWTP